MQKYQKQKSKLLGKNESHQSFAYGGNDSTSKIKMEDGRRIYYSQSQHDVLHGIDIEISNYTSMALTSIYEIMEN